MNLIAITSTHDRRPPGFVAAMTPGERIVLRAVADLATSAVARDRPKLADDDGFLSTRLASGLVEDVARLGAVCTSEHSLTMCAGAPFTAAIRRLSSA